MEIVFTVIITLFLCGIFILATSDSFKTSSDIFQLGIFFILFSLIIFALSMFYRGIQESTVRYIHNNQMTVEEFAIECGYELDK